MTRENDGERRNNKAVMETYKQLKRKQDIGVIVDPAKNTESTKIMSQINRMIAQHKRLRGDKRLNYEQEQYILPGSRIQKPKGSEGTSTPQKSDKVAQPQLKVISELKCERQSLKRKVKQLQASRESKRRKLQFTKNLHDRVVRLQRQIREFKPKVPQGYAVVKKARMSQLRVHFQHAPLKQECRS